MKRQTDNPARILVVDDQESMLGIAEKILTECGYRVIKARDGKEALSLFDREQPNLIVMDAVMPAMDGFEACQKIKQQPDGSDLPLIMLTSLDDEKSVNRAFEVGADEYITKPINWTILLHRIKYLVAGKKDRDALTVAQAESQATHNRLELIFDNISSPIAYLDPEFNYIKVNQAYAESGNRSIDYFPGKNHFALYPNSENETIFQQVVKSGEAYHAYAKGFEYEGQPEQGVTYWDWSLHPVKDAWNDTNGLLLNLTDVTHRIESEEQIRISENNIRTLLNAPTESALLMSVDGTVLAVNDIHAQRLGKTPSELIGINIFDLFPKEVSDYHKKMVQQVIDSHEPIVFEDSRQGFRFKTTIYPIFDNHNEVNRLAVYAVDITEKIRSESIERLRTEVNSQILEEAPINDIFVSICNHLISLFALQLVWVGEKISDGSIQINTMVGEAQSYGNELKRIGVRWDDSPLGKGPSGTSIRTEEMALIKSDDPKFAAWRDAAIENNLHSTLAIPLHIHRGIYGTMVLYSSNPTIFDDFNVIRHLNEISDQIQIVLDTAKTQEQLRLQSTALENAGNAIFITDRNGTIERVNGAYERLTGYSAKESIGQQPSFLKSGVMDTIYYKKLWQSLLAGERYSREIVNRRKDGTLYTAQQTITNLTDNNGIITHFISIQEDITEKRAAEEKIKHLALHDPLTDLPNRSLFSDRLQQAIHSAHRDKQKVGLLFIDLNLFKQVNDSLGHDIGDELLKAVTTRLLNETRSNDTVARMGGDEFTIILQKVSGPDDMALIAQKIIASIAKPFEILEHSIEIGCSIGGSIYPTDAKDSETLLKQADSAMYRAKKC
ncbi:MAG: diguanylate cyclase, partial [Gammaproteobacteria bacterium]|nr:diguanylate cyclase [Gammaproteobacteria bacterium]